MNSIDNEQSQKLTLLAVLAHPDDESFGMGGTLALYARRGVEVHLVCATRGEVGDVDAEYMQGFDSIAQLREHELRCAAEHLGLSGVHFLDYRDSGMPGSEDNAHPRALAAAPVEEVAGKIVTYIRRLRPQVVLTFDPIGGYRHPDHIAIHEATKLAFHGAADQEAFPGELPPYQPQKLYYNTLPRRLMRWAVRLMPLFGVDPHRFGHNEDVDLVALLNEDFPVHARIDYNEVADKKRAASACHASQGGLGLASGPWPMRIAFRLLGSTENFMQAYPPVVNGSTQHDLFSGISAGEKAKEAA